MSEGSSRNWIVTGATGFIGRELVNSLLRTTTDTLTLLVRPTPGGQSPRQRIQSILQGYGIPPTACNRITVLSSDLGKPQLGISHEQIAQLAVYDNIFIHLAANTRFNEALAESRRDNLQGAQSAAELALALHARDALSRFVYTSTAYVHGHHSGQVTQHTPLQPSLARNAYEQSKCEAEIHVQNLARDCPVTVVRPSIVVGHSESGRMTGFGTIYWAIKLYCAGHHRFFARPDARLDIVPVDSVVNALVTLSRHPGALSRVYPLVSGHQRDITIQQLADAIADRFQLAKPVLMNPDRLKRFGSLAHLASISLGQRMVMEQMQNYLPYFTHNPRFDSTVTDHALAGTAVQLAPFNEYSHALFDYCEQLGWSEPRPAVAVS